MSEVEDLIKELANEVDGSVATDENVIIFTLSTCQWCKRCKRYLNDKDVKYRYIDVDKIDPAKKAKLIEYLRDNYQSRISYPFLVCEKGHVVGYDPEKYDEIIGGGA